MVKALFPIGKTQWLKWSDAQRTAFNEAREAGVAYNDAIQAANATETPKKKGIFDKIADVVEDVTEVAEAVAPVVAVAKTVAAVAKVKKDK